MSSPALLAERVRNVARAFDSCDEVAIRGELRLLAQEAELLARRDPRLDVREPYAEVKYIPLGD